MSDQRQKFEIAKILIRKQLKTFYPKYEWSRDLRKYEKIKDKPKKKKSEPRDYDDEVMPFEF